MTKGFDSFRPEVMSHRSQRLSGEVSIAVPVSWQSVGYLIFGGVAATLTFLSVASYSRVVTVKGEITTDKGVLAIFPSRNGVVAALSAKNGIVVAAGANLAVIRAEEDRVDGASTGARIEAAVRAQDASLAMQGLAIGAAAKASIQQLQLQQSGLAAEIAQLGSQISLQETLIASAQKSFDRALLVAERGFVSQRDVDLREETLLSRKQALSQLRQALAGKQSALAEAGRNIAQRIAGTAEQQAGLAANRAAVSQLAATTEGARSYVLRAPIAGRIAALVAHPGQTVTAQDPMMTIVPAASVLRAELKVPSSAISFLKPRQTVTLAIDAFPYQRFGTVKGRVLTVSTSPISSRESDGSAISVYPISVALDRSTVSAFDRNEPLLVGMTLTARIVTEKQSLIEWLFEPLLAVQRRAA